MLYHLIGFPVGETAKKYHASKTVLIYGHDSLGSIRTFNRSCGYQFPFLDRQCFPDTLLDAAMAVTTEKEWYDVLDQLALFNKTKKAG